MFKYVELGKKNYWIKGEKTEGLNVTQGAILAMEPSTGYIKLLQGGVTLDNSLIVVHKQKDSQVHHLNTMYT